jgi:LmbE family N-acetylglucosaminyl deacetylase
MSEMGRALLDALAATDTVIPGTDTVVVIAHPDDETLGVGGQLARLKGCGIIVVTDGAPRDPSYARRRGFENTEAYAQARRQEIIAAAAISGVPDRALTFLNVADQEAAWHLANITHSLVHFFVTRGTKFVMTRGTKFVMTHSYEGGHPDHDATAFAVNAATQILASCGRTIEVVEMPFYRMGSPGRLYQSFTEQLAGRQLKLILTGERLAIKLQMLECHATQRSALCKFSPDIEQFRLAPRHDFSTLPNNGRLFYETRPWGMTASRWLTLTSQAANQLDVQAAQWTDRAVLTSSLPRAGASNRSAPGPIRNVS